MDRVAPRRDPDRCRFVRLEPVTRPLPNLGAPPSDARGEVRLVTPQLDWAGFIRLGFDEIRLAGVASPQVARRLRAALEDLVTVAPPDRQEPMKPARVEDVTPSGA